MFRSSQFFLPLRFPPAAFCALLACLLSIGCDQKNETLVDSVGAPPVIVASSLVPSAVDTDTIVVGPQPLPEDLLDIRITAAAHVAPPESGPLTVAGTVFSAADRSPRASLEFRNDGISPDASATDSIWTSTAVFTIARSEVGIFPVEISAESDAGFRSNTHVLSLRIFRLNEPPVLSNLQAPDTVSLGQQTFRITAQATDPNGLADVKSVVRRTQLGNVYPLNDSGQNGDLTAGDGIFTETVSLETNPPPPGTYTFTFQAFDQLNAASNILSKTIVVVP